MQCDDHHGYRALAIRLRRMFVDREDELEISRLLGWVLTPIQEQRT
jgi:hypothetical protein